jgi:hypothetical protein
MNRDYRVVLSERTARRELLDAAENLPPQPGAAAGAAARQLRPAGLPRRDGRGARDPDRRHPLRPAAGLPIDRLSLDEAKALYWVLSSMLARPVAQKLDGTIVYDVHDTGQQALPGSGIRPDKTNIDLQFHNDNAYNFLMPSSSACCACARPGTAA